MYSKKFENVSKLLKACVESGEVAGTSICIIKSNKEVYRENIGFANLEKQIPIENDTIYRLFSMTKPITAVAMMILYERGLFDLNEPISNYIPAYKSSKIVTADGIIDAKNQITIKHLFNMTSGIPYPANNSVSSIEVNKIFSRMSTDIEKGNSWTTQKFGEAFATVPLAFEPGQGWTYGLSADILGCLVEIISGKSFGEFLKDEIFEPLDMEDTGFWVPKEKKERLAQVYEFDKESKLIPFLRRHLGLNIFFSKPPFESGGAGLMSTIDDYSRFTAMLLNEGIFNCQKILSRKSVELMTSNHLNDVQMKYFSSDKLSGYGYGMLMRTMVNPAQAGCIGSVGEFGWDSWSGNWFCIDPKEKLIIIFMMQHALGMPKYFVSKLKATIYSTLE